MRTYGRIRNQDGSKTWVEVTTDAQGFNDAVYLTTLIQCFKLNLNESPFWSNFGIPAEQSVITQIAPDYYVNFMQQYFAQFFANLIAYRQPADPLSRQPLPTYVVNVLTHYGSRIRVEVPV